MLCAKALIRLNQMAYLLAFMCPFRRLIINCIPLVGCKVITFYFFLVLEHIIL